MGFPLHHGQLHVRLLRRYEPCRPPGWSGVACSGSDNRVVAFNRTGPNPYQGCPNATLLAGLSHLESLVWDSGYTYQYCSMPDGLSM
jgi:hypothetical protein